jgi:hypothetical protein
MTPATVPAEVNVGEADGSPTSGVFVSNALARPKSSTLIVPSGATCTFAGLRSRWITPLACAASSASASWRATASVSSSESASRASRWDRFSPGAYSIARKRTPS